MMTPPHSTRRMLEYGIHDATLNLCPDGSPPHSRLIRFPSPGIKLNVKLIPGFYDLTIIKVYTNIPEAAEVEFERTRFHCFKGGMIESQDGEWMGCIILDRPGAFEIYVEGIPEDTYNNGVKVVRSTTTKLVVDPILPNINRLHVPLDGLCVQTVLGKLISPIDDWDQEFSPIASSGYNCVHFSPVQQRGGSDSCYSIRDQLYIDDELFSSYHKKEEMTEEVKRQKLKEAIEGLAKHHGLLSMTDIVLNHTSYDSPWLADQPDATYNNINSPHLIPAYKLDTLILELSMELGTGECLTADGENLKAEMTDPFRVELVAHELRRRAHQLCLWEYFQIDINKTIESLIELSQQQSSTNSIKNEVVLSLKQRCDILNNGLYHEKTQSTFPIRIKKDAMLNAYAHLMNEPSLLDTCREDLEELNKKLMSIYNIDIESAFSSIKNTAMYEWLDPRTKRGLGKVSSTPGFTFVSLYFTRNHQCKDPTQQPMFYANNGFIWNGNPLIDFASTAHTPHASNSYFARHLVIWGDCVKLRYGQCKEDSPWLWDRMREYVNYTVDLFHGVRIDNAHGTPLHVAKYMLDEARKIRPHLYVCAELFTGSEELDIKFVAELGISSLIREAMQASNVENFSHYVWSFSGQSIGSFHTEDERIKNCLPSPLNAMFYDCTHDNETPHQKRSAADSLPTAALVAMTQCAIGSTRGFDQLVPETLSVVTEKRPYRPPDALCHVSCMLNGFSRIKGILNRLHTWMACHGFEEIYVDQGKTQGHPDILTVTRSNPSTGQYIVMICRTSFGHAASNASSTYSINLEGEVGDVVLGATLSVLDEPFKKSPFYINGLNFVVQCSTTSFSPYATITKKDDKSHVLLDLNAFVPGSVLGFIVNNCEKVACELICRLPEGVDKEQKDILKHLLQNDSIKIDHLGTLLFSSPSEEYEISKGQRNGYDVPHYGMLPWTGIAGAYAIFRNIQRENNLGHPLADNLRNGSWLCDYLITHANQIKSLSPIANWMERQFNRINQVPKSMRPLTFWKIIRTLTEEVCQAAYLRMDPMVQNSGKFVQSLALTHLMLLRHIPTSSLSEYNETTSSHLSLAAGIPHFATGYMRNWGRDTFIALRGLVLIPGRHEEAKNIICAYASVLRHGMIPNLLDSGRNPRFNARDATWWFMNAIQSYCEIVPNGEKILNEEIVMKYHSNDIDDHRYYEKRWKLINVINNILENHVNGISFREWNAGKTIDSQMKDEGFNIKVDFDPQTGFIHGGNEWNCGTWMDKMGESTKAGTQGKPATPRDGADIEIIALLASNVKWLAGLYDKKIISMEGVKYQSSTLSFRQWFQLIQNSFEKEFFIPMEEKDDSQYHLDSKLINRRGIYKDTVGSTAFWTDYQLRPNQVIAMAVAPDLFNPVHAKQALRNIESNLFNAPTQLGIKTLDPKDWGYRGDYDNCNDSEDAGIAKGFNYHQGPEWLWPVGYYLRARYIFPKEEWKSSSKKALAERYERFTFAFLKNHSKHIKESIYMGLPELTNHDGYHCPPSCEVQSWSMSTLLDAYYDIYKMKNN